MGIPFQPEAVDQENLSAPVRRLLQSATVEVADWQVRRLGGGFGNPVSLGLYRYAGKGRDRGQHLPWSLVLKVAQSPSNVGASDMGEGEDQTHWNYWKREMHVYESDLLDSLPGGLVAPRCFGIEERPGNIVWLWLEEVVDIYKPSWSLDRYALAARHFGRFNGVYLSAPSLPAYPWLSVGLLRQWCASLDDWLPLFSDLHRRPSAWEHPLLLRIFPHPEQNPFWRLLVEREQFLTALERLPQTICHKDAYPTNLMARRGKDGEEQTVALDWALAGIGPVGEEMAQLALGALDEIEGVAAAEVDQAVFSGYLEGLREMGWPGDAQVVRFGFVASFVFRVGLMLLWSLSQAIERSPLDGRNEVEGPSVAEPIEGSAKQARLVLASAGEAYELLGAVT